MVEIKKKDKDSKSSRNETREMKPTKKKNCLFCEGKLTPIYTDTVTLRKFTSSRGKIVNKSRSGVCSKHQRALTREIKHARHLALLPFTLEV